MERQRLIKLIENKGTSSKEETTDLWDIVRTFPYFQTARLLLVKSFHNQGSIHFHNELKTAAAYASDRKVLFHLINDETTRQTTDEESNVFAIEQKQFQKEEPALKLSESYSENQFAISEEGIAESRIPETIYKEEPKIQEKQIIEEKKATPEPTRSFSFDEPSTSNEEIIRRRLSEILSRSKPEEKEIISKEIQKAPVPEIKEVVEAKIQLTETPLTKEEEPVSNSGLSELLSEPADAIEGLEIETIIEESYLQELEKLPEITRSTIIETEVETIVSEPTKSDSQELSFIDWLKHKNGKETTLEEVIDDDAILQPSHHTVSPPSGDRGASALIDKFIADKPRIAPPKAEFYSPANMARQSITDNEDIISETLARIYFDQGNYPKARSCYEKLTLLYPEKSASFAPLIEKIDEIIAGSGKTGEGS